MARDDRVVIKYGPAKLDDARTIKRAIEQATPTTTTGGVAGFNPDDYVSKEELPPLVDDIIAEYPPVQGGGGFVIGAPAGTPFAYIPANLVNFPINLEAIAPIAFTESSVTSGGANTGMLTSGSFNADVNNVFGHGVNSFMTWDDPNGRLVLFSPAVGLLTTVGFTVTSGTYITGFCSVGSSILSTGRPGTANAGGLTVYVYDGSSVSTVTMALPVGASTTVVCSGANADNTKYIVVYRSITLNQLILGEYSTAGTLLAQTTINVGSSVSQSSGRIQNGYVMIAASLNVLVICKTNASAPDIKIFSIPFVSRNLVDNFSATTDGYVWLPAITGSGPTIDLYRVNHTAGLADVFPGALNNPLDVNWATTPYLAQWGGLFTRPAAGCAAVSSSIVAFTGVSFAVDEFGTYYYVPTFVFVTITAEAGVGLAFDVQNDLATPSDGTADGQWACSVYKLPNGSLIWATEVDDLAISYIYNSAPSA